MKPARIAEDVRRSALRIADEARARTSTTEGALLGQLADAVAALGAWAVLDERDAIAIDRAMGASLDGIAAYRAGEALARLQGVADALQLGSREPTSGEIGHRTLELQAADEIRAAATMLRGLLVGGGS